MSSGYKQDSGAARDVVGYLSGARGDDFSGAVGTPHGYVRVHGFKPVGRLGATTYLDFVYAGRWYRRSWKRLLTQLGATRAAGRFAREIAAAHSRGGR